MTRRLLIVLPVVMCMLVVSRALAETRVTVHDFYGPNAERVRDDVVNLLEGQDGVTLVSKAEIESTAKKLGVDPFSPDGRRALSRELQLSAWMTGMVQKHLGKLKLTVVVYDGAKHTRIGRAQLVGRNATRLSAEIKHHLWRRSGTAIMQAEAPEAPAAKVEEPKPELNAAVSSARRLRDDGAASGGESDSWRGAGEALRAVVGIGTPYRSLAYNDAVSQVLGDYRLNGAPMIDLGLNLHPLRFMTDGWPSWFGVDVRAQIALSAPTTNRDGQQFKSRYDAYHIGLRARIPVGAHYVSAFSGYAMNRFEISPVNGSVSAPTPSVDYRTIRSGLGAELSLTDAMAIGVEGAWLNVLSVGDIGQWFPRSTAGGVELGMFATYAMTRGFYARVAAAYQRTFFDFNSQPGDKYIAGGATDQYLALSLGAGVRL
ncbi:MAG: hypothetical protein ABW321_23360 [Polyangiales bacterium]